MDRIHKALFRKVAEEVRKEQGRGEEERIWQENAPDVIHWLFRKLKQQQGGSKKRGKTRKRKGGGQRRAGTGGVSR
jgi:hypothetical protein